MKRFFKAIILCLILSLVLAACNAESGGNIANVENPDFRNVKWGMSKDDVVSIEGLPYFDKDDYLLKYNVTVVDYAAELTYYFDIENNALTKAKYNFNCDDKTDLQINTMKNIQKNTECPWIQVILCQIWIIQILQNLHIFLMIILALAIQLYIKVNGATSTAQAYQCQCYMTIQLTNLIS